MIKLLLRSILFLFCLQTINAQSHSDKLNVLIVDGFSNHDWKQTSFIVKQILEKSDLFHVDISTAPAEQENGDWENWRPKFKNYDVVIQNTNNIQNKSFRWPREVEKDLEEYISAGGGLFILHSANNAFAKWEAYNLMIGLGWRSKDEGVALQINENKEIVTIPVGEGKSTNHGPRNDLVIHLLNEHPIHTGFPKAWKTPDMELYKFARGPAKNLTVLSYAKDKKTNINWPAEWVVSYGKGRVYNSSMGHLWKGDNYPVSYRCVGFQTILIRTTEWLATGKITSKIPNNFPNKNQMVILDSSENKIKN